MMPCRRATSWAAIAWALLAAAEARGHIPLHGVGTACRVIFKEDRVLLTFDLSYDSIWAQAEMLAADGDRSSAVEEEEAEAYLKKRWEEKVSPRIKVKLDGKEIPFAQASARHEGLVGEIYGVPFSLYYELEAAFPGGRIAPGSVHTLEIEDTVVRDETPARPMFYVPYRGHGLTEAARFNPQFSGEPLLDLDSYLIHGSPLVVKFSFDPAAAAAAGSAPREAAPPPRRETAPPAPAPGAAPEADLERAVRDLEKLPWYAVLGFILLSIAYGAGHALAPGHGKAMVAAYLIGTKGTVRDAVVLGLATTVTHTGSVFLFGIAIFLIVNASARLSEGALHNMVIVGTQLISGLLLLVLGLALFFRRWRGLEGHHHHHHGHDHHHDHGHGHSHEHHHHDHHHDHGHHHHPPLPAGLLQGGAPRLRDLVALGFSGGIVPCPAGLTVILIGLRYPDRLLFVLGLLVCFSIGLGAVLTGIGVSLVTGKALLAARAKEGAFFQELSFLRAVFPLPFLAWLDRSGGRLLGVLPSLSALFIAGLGAFFCVGTYATGKTEIAGMLRQLADWIK